MKWSNVYRMRLVLVGFVAAIVLGGGSAKGDFTFGEPTNLGPMVNSSSFEQTACISADGLSLYFASDRPDQVTEEIWLSTRPTTDDPWGPPENLGLMVNSEAGAFHPFISADELELYFERFEPGTGSNFYNFSIWMAKRANKDTAWEQPVKLDLTIPEGFMPGDPSLTGDGLELYFAAYRFGYESQSEIYESQSEIYVAKRETKDAPWGEPVNLGPVVNSWTCQAMPAISSDGLLLVFNDWWFGNARSGGFGCDDIWFTRRATRDSGWSEPVNLGASINTAGYDYSGMVSADGSTLYFTTEDWVRPGGQGNDDLWQAPIIPIVDLNADGIVDSADMCIVVDHWGEDYSLCDVGPMPWGDGVVDVQDLIVLAEHLFEKIPPAEEIE